MFLFEKDSLSRSCLAVGNDETQNNSSNNNRHSRTEEQSIWNLSLTTNPIITSKKNGDRSLRFLKLMYGFLCYEKGG
ncbi:hypothetical protein CWN83_05575 [Vibrio splendidus]|nr:hypothetical protein CWN83_05575 [Vibrio splendidus]